MRPRILYSLIFTFILVILSDGVSAREYPIGWRSYGAGRYLEADPPIKWSSSHNVAWKTAMPSWSNASPVLPTDSLMIVCSEPNQVLGIDPRKGSIVWQQSLGDVSSEEPVGTHGANGYTSHTPLSDGRRIYTVFGSGVVAAHTPEGKRVWARVVERPQHGWGHSASPAMGGGRLIVHITDLIALDPATGDEVWRQASQEKFGSPVVTQVGGKDIVITPVGDVFRAADGKPLAQGIGKLEYATPVIQDGIVYFIEKKATAVKLPDEIDGAYESLWTARVQGSRHYSSPVIHEGLIYAISREEKFSILDAKTGAPVFAKDLDLGTETNSAYTSITLAGDKLFIGAESGTTVVIAPGKTYQEIGRNAVEGFRSSPVFVGKRMYLRAFDHLYCFEKR